MYKISQVEDYMNTVKLDKSPQTVRSYDLAIRKLFDFLKIETFENIVSITPANIREFQTVLVSSGVQKSSANAYVRPLKAMFNWFVEQEFLDNSPFNKVKLLKTSKKNLPYLSEEEVALMLAGCVDTEEKLIIAMLVSMGLRRSELTNIKMENIHFNQLDVQGKGDKYRSVYFQDDVYELFEKFLKERKDPNFEYLFRSKMGSKYAEGSIAQMVKKIAKNANIDQDKVDKISPHIFRRTFATNLVENGTDIRVIQGALGHANIATTMKYANLRNSAVEKAMTNQKRIV
jgi:site-specific recombinase XerD